MQHSKGQKQILADTNHDSHKVAFRAAGCVLAALTVHYENSANNNNLQVVPHLTLCNAVTVFIESQGILSHSSVQRSNACHIGTCGKLVSIDDMYSHIPLQNRFESLQCNEEHSNKHPIQCESPSYSVTRRHGHSQMVPNIHAVPVGQKVQALPHAEGQECREYQQCKAQIGVQFGCVPLSPIKLYTGLPIYWKKIPDIIHAHLLVRESLLPNILGMCILKIITT